jgi:hypothetical protein
MSIINFFILRLFRCLKERRFQFEACLLLLPLILLLTSVRLLVKE